MLFYRYFAGRSRKALAETLAAEDPFALPPAEIVERILELGNVPDVTVPLREMWPTVGRVYAGLPRGDRPGCGRDQRAGATAGSV